MTFILNRLGKIVISTLLLLFLNNLIHAQNNLTAGDLAIVSYQSDFDPTNTFTPGVPEFEDRFSLVITKPGGIAAGTVLFFTTRGWNGPLNTWHDEDFPPNTFGLGRRAVVQWTVPAGGISQGTEIFFINTFHDELAAGSEYYSWAAYANEAGTTLINNLTNVTPIVPAANSTDGMSFAVSGDKLLVYQTGPVAGPNAGPNNSTIRFITALLANNNGTTVAVGTTTYANWDAVPGAMASNESSVPPGLINGESCFLMSPSLLPAVSNGTTEPDNGKFSACALSSAGACTALQMSTIIYATNPSGSPTTPNWTYNNAVFPLGTSSSVCTYNILSTNTITLTSGAGTNIQTVVLNTPITNITYSTTTATGATFGGLPPGVTGSWSANVVTISGSPTTAVGSPFNYTVTLTGGCGIITASGTITVPPCGVINQTVSASPTSVCVGGSSTITVGASQPGVNYTLRVDPANTFVAGPTASNGPAINLSTGPIAATTTYNLLAETDKYSINIGGGQAGFIIPEASPLDVTNNFTIEGWIKPNNAVGFSRLFNKNQAYALGLSNGQSNITFTVHNSGDYSLPYSFVTGTWYHIACTYNFGVVEFFVNGTSLGTVSGVPGISLQNQGAQIGSEAGGGFHHFEGNIDNVRIWNSSRTQAQIAANQAAFLTSTGNPSLVASWWIIESTGNAKDYSANAINSTGLVGTWQVDSPVPPCNITLTTKPTITVAAPVVLNCPVNTTTAACQTQAAVNSAFTTWLATASASGGSNGVLTNNNSGAPSACGGSTTVTFTYTTTCSSPTTTCQATFTVTASPSVVLTCPVNTTAAACQTQAAVNTAFATWLATATSSGGCNGVLTNNNTGAPSACGGSTTVTFTYTSSCAPLTSTCQATFTVTASPSVVLTCPVNTTAAACQTQAAVNTAFATWLATASASGGCNGTLTNNNTGAPNACGGSTTVTFTYTSSCAPLTTTCQATFTVTASPSVVLTCPVNTTAAACQTQAAVNTAFATWLATASASGGCNGTLTNNNTGAPSACGGSTTVTFSYTSSCAPLTTTCQATFTVTASPSVVLTCPVNTTAAACQTQAAVNTAFATWLSTASASGGCNGTLTNNNTGAPSACGGSTTVTFTYTNSCAPLSSTCQATFTVTASPSVVLTCPANTTIAACQTQAAVNTAFATWLATASASGGCNGTLTNDNTGVPSACGGSTTVTFTYTNSCAPLTSTCQATFTVTASPSVVLTCPVNTTTAACQTQAAVNTSFATWLATASASGGCNGVFTNNNSGAPSNCGGSTTVTFTYTSSCAPLTSTCQATFTVTSSPSVVLTCPVNTTTAACQTQAAVNTAFATWLATASASGGCNGVFTNNNSGAPSNCGGSTTVTFTYTSSCAPLTSTCQATFTVTSSPSVVLTCPVNTTTAACQTQAAVNTAFATWLATASASGGCNGVFTNNNSGAPSNCGGSTTVIFTYTSSCAPLTTTCQATFTVTSSSAVSVICPVFTTTAACQTQAAVDAAFATWLATASASGGCNGVLTNNNTGAPSACGGSAAVVFTYTSSCAPIISTCQSTFTVASSPAVAVICPVFTTTAACQTQASVDAAFATWLATASASGGCNGVLTNNNTGAPSACGGSAAVVFTYTSSCAPLISTCQSTFTVAPSPSVVLSCPVNTTSAACQTQSAVNTAFATWLATASASGGCNGVLTNNNTGAPSICGGSTTVTFTYTSSCAPTTTTCQATFTVTASPSVVLTCAVNTTTAVNQTQAAVNTAFATWLATASASGGCNGVLTNNNTGAPSNCGGSTTVTFTYMSSCAPTTSTCQATFTVPPSTVNAVATPASQTICSASTITSIVLTGSVSGTTYAWTRNNTTTVTGIAASGSGNISGTLTNTTAAPVTVTFTITPTANGCPGPAITATVLVNPTPNAVATPASQGICTGSNIIPIILTGAVSGTTYTWTRNNTATVTGIAASGSGNITGGLVNNTASSITVTFTITPMANGCTGPTATATVIVNPNPIGTISIVPNPACVGSTVQLSSSGGSTYSWAGPLGYTSTLQNPTILLTTYQQGGQYKVTITSGPGCSVVKSAVLTVNYPPVITASYDQNTACTGSSLQLHGTGGGSYTWSGPAGFASNKQHPVVSNVTSANNGIYTLTVTSPNGCTATTTLNITINTPPQVSANPTLTQTCEGSTVQLSASGSGSFSWSGPAGWTSINQNPVINNIPVYLSGTYTVTLTGNTGCTSTASVAIKVYDQINAVATASPNPVCEGQSLQLHAEGGYGYIWTGPNGFYSYESDPRIDNISKAHAGSYYVFVTNEGGCSGYAEVKVEVLPTMKATASASPNPVAEFSPVQFTCSDGLSYSWTGPLGFTSTQQNPSIKKVTRYMAGIYIVTIINENGCPSIVKVNLRVTYKNKENSIGAETTDKSELLETRTEKVPGIYPNPTNDYLYFESESTAAIEYRIYDLSGREHVRLSTTTDQSISTSQLSIGVYQIRWKPKDSDTWINSRFIKIR